MIQKTSDHYVGRLFEVYPIVKTTRSPRYVQLCALHISSEPYMAASG